MENNNCFVDITLEFLSVAFHNILYYSNIYPKSIFESRRKYSIAVQQSIHPEVNKYITLTLKTIEECLKKNGVTRIQFALTNAEFEPLIKFMFDIDVNRDFNETSDAYLIHCEQNMRAFCLNLCAKFHLLKPLPEDASFSINIHTNESTAIALSSDPQFEDFPMIETNKNVEFHNVVPLRQFSVMNYNLSSYIEM